MHPDLMDLLVCPACHGKLVLETEREGADGIESGRLDCQSCRAAYPIVRFVPRFVPAENYPSGVGLQWNNVRRTQLDSSTGQPIARDRFFAESGWPPSEMDGRWTLDGGCGAGRFAEVALGTGARVVAVDYSTAVDACQQNLGHHPRLDVLQADVYRLPLRDRQFDFVYCFGVLQHTPDVHDSFLALADQVRAGGRIAVDLSPPIALKAVSPKYWLRPWTTRLPAGQLFAFVSRMVDVLWPVSLALGRVPGVGRKLRHALPIANHEGLLPLTPMQLKEWAVLDTFDMLAPAHDHPQTVETLQEWFQEAQFREVEIFRHGLVVGRGRQQRLPVAGETPNRTALSESSPQ